jgi:hypothetical protein
MQLLDNNRCMLQKCRLGAIGQQSLAMTYHAESKPEQQPSEPCNDLKVQADANSIAVPQQGAAGSNVWGIL